MRRRQPDDPRSARRVSTGRLLGPPLDFLKTSGAMIVSFTLAEAPIAHAQRGAIVGSPSLTQLDSWLAIAADGKVTAFSGKEEMGQGISTAQIQLVAEELCVPLHRVRLLYCDTAITPDQAHTAGSQSHPTNFNHDNLAQSAATARETILRLGSERLNIPVDQLTARDGGDCRQGRTVEERHLWPTDRWQEVQPRAGS